MSAAAAPLHATATGHLRAFGTVVPFPLAQTGEGISECELVQWFVQEGDMVAEFDKICEVQSDKATIEITSRYAGRVAQLVHAAGAVVKVGEALVMIELHDSVGVAPAEAAHAVAAATPAALQAQVQPDPAGKAAHAAAVSSQVNASPAVRRAAREHGLDLCSICGTGPDGRITQEDLHRALAAGGAAREAAASTVIGAFLVPPAVGPDMAAAAPCRAPAAVVSQPRLLRSGEHPASHVAAASAPPYVHPNPERHPIRGYRRAMVKSMTAAAHIPHFHFCDEVHMDALIAVRKKLQGDDVMRGAKLTFLPFLLKALSAALQQHPGLNSSLACHAAAGGQDELLLHGDHNIGVAMATSAGLVVPNVKQVQHKSVCEVAWELQRLQDAALLGKLGRDDLAHGTITLSNIGSIGGTYATPLVNASEVAIVALGRVQLLPRFDAHGTVVGCSLMSISWGADHRAVDGAALARFSNCWKGYIEEPTRLLLTLK